MSGFDGRYRGVRVAVLGASGFIGRWVARKLCAAGASTCLVIRNSARVARIFAEYKVSGDLVEADLSDARVLGDIYSRIRPAITFNLVSYGVNPTESDKSLSYRINADLPKEICEAAADWKDPTWPGQHLVHAGSVLEYGEARGDLREDGIACPTTVYGKSKLKGTHMIAEACAVLGLRGLTARLGTVYGPGEDPGRLLPSLIQASRTGQALNLTAGTQRRDFTYVGDVADGLLRLGLAEEVAPGSVVNLATGELASVRDFIETAASILEIPSTNLRFGAIPTRVEEMQHDPIRIERLRSMLAWRPPTSIKEGIRMTAVANRK